MLPNQPLLSELNRLDAEIATPARIIHRQFAFLVNLISAREKLQPARLQRKELEAVECPPAGQLDGSNRALRSRLGGTQTPVSAANQRLACADTKASSPNWPSPGKPGELSKKPAINSNVGQIAPESNVPLGR